MKAGIVALQGDVDLHEKALKRYEKDVEIVRVKNPEDLEKLDLLIFPGGESPTMSKLMERFGLKDALLKKITEEKTPTLATCAGIVLLSKLEEKDGRVEPFEVLDVVLVRNGFGRQRESFEGEVNVKFDDKESVVTGVFIRAPRIKNLGDKAKPIAFLKDEVVGVMQENIIALTFHPELSSDTEIIYEKLFSLAG